MITQAYFLRIARKFYPNLVRYISSFCVQQWTCLLLALGSLRSTDSHGSPPAYVSLGAPDFLAPTPVRVVAPTNLASTQVFVRPILKQNNNAHRKLYSSASVFHFVVWLQDSVSNVSKRHFLSTIFVVLCSFNDFFSSWGHLRSLDIKFLKHDWLFWVRTLSSWRKELPQTVLMLVAAVKTRWLCFQSRHESTATLSVACWTLCSWSKTGLVLTLT